MPNTRVHLVVLTNRAKSPKSSTSSAEINIIDFLTVLRFSFLVPVVSRFASEHKKFLARSLRLRNILNLTWEQVFDLLHSSLLIKGGSKGNTLWFCFESNWKNMKNRCSTKVSGMWTQYYLMISYNNSNVIVQAKKPGNYMYSVVWRWDYDLFHASMQQGKAEHRVSKASSLSLTFNSH